MEEEGPPAVTSLARDLVQGCRKQKHYQPLAASTSDSGFERQVWNLGAHVSGAGVALSRRSSTLNTHAARRLSRADSVLPAGMGVGLSAPQTVLTGVARSHPRSPGLSASESRCRHSFAVSGASFQISVPTRSIHER